VCQSESTPMHWLAPMREGGVVTPKVSPRHLKQARPETSALGGTTISAVAGSAVATCSRWTHAPIRWYCMYLPHFPGPLDRAPLRIRQVSRNICVVVVHTLHTLHTVHTLHVPLRCPKPCCLSATTIKQLTPLIMLRVPHSSHPSQRKFLGDLLGARRNPRVSPGAALAPGSHRVVSHCYCRLITHSLEPRHVTPGRAPK
jgi:hypothetical protein